MLKSNLAENVYDRCTVALSRSRLRKYDKDEIDSLVSRKKLVKLMINYSLILR